MAQASDLSLITEPLVQIMELQERQGAILTAQQDILIRLEQREVPDLKWLERMVEDLTDRLDKWQFRDAHGRKPWPLLVVRTMCWILIGYLVCWGTVRWLPTTLLPPGFSRPAGTDLTTKQQALKGRL